MNRADSIGDPGVRMPANWRLLRPRQDRPADEGATAQAPQLAPDVRPPTVADLLDSRERMEIESARTVVRERLERTADSKDAGFARLVSEHVQRKLREAVADAVLEQDEIHGPGFDVYA